ncbi:MAG: SpoIVB peptidase [Oscillospiraceae bacterium]|nr:SpoIVB peptidase [Oscillospiraceae bacterium]
MKNFKISSKIFVAIIISLSLIVAASAAESLIPLGHTTGISISSEGAVVVGFSEDLTPNPARDAGIAPGDIIKKIENKKISQNADILSAVLESDGNPVTIEYVRNGKTHTVKVCPTRTEDGSFVLGIWVRDSVAGIGTLTYLNPEDNSYGALGHGISDSKTNTLIPLSDGELFLSSVQSVKRGKSGEPGELIGSFDTSAIFANISKNTEAGIFGKIKDPDLLRGDGALPIAKPNEIKKGEATILSNVEGDEVKEYKIEIMNIYHGGEATKNMLIRATDPTLLEKTGGIVCGMSGSPIIQDGKLVGAVTHVLVNDPTKGYGIFIENMLDIAE